MLDPGLADSAIAGNTTIFDSHTLFKLAQRREPSFRAFPSFPELIVFCLPRNMLPFVPKATDCREDSFLSQWCTFNAQTPKCLVGDILARTASCITQAIFPASNCISCRFHFQNDASALFAKASRSINESVALGDTSSRVAVSGMLSFSPKGKECSVRKRNIHSSIRCELVPPDRRHAR